VLVEYRKVWKGGDVDDKSRDLQEVVGFGAKKRTFFKGLG
jgi:hypothetical protein